MAQRASLMRISLVLLSFVLWTAWELGRGCHHPYHDLSCGRFTDHFSHMNAARVFPRIGTDIWHRSFKSMFRALSPGEAARLPEEERVTEGSDVRFVPGWDTKKPLAASWSHHPRLYPPGDMLLVAPVALLYHYTGIGFGQVTVVLIILFLVYAHLALYVALPTDWSRIPLLATLLLYFETIHWTLEGFYDAAAIFPLLLCATWLRSGRGLAATVAYCCAILIHFRALFFLPWGAYAVWMVLRGRQWRRWRAPDYWAAAGCLLMLAASAIPFWWLWPTLQNLPNVNPISLAADQPDRAAQASLAVLAVIAAVTFLWNECWLDLAMLGWFCVMLLSLREAYPWHLLLPLAWLTAPVLRARSSKPRRYAAWAVHDARILVLVSAGMFVFKYSPLPTWLIHVF